MILRRIPLSISCLCMLAFAGCGFHPRAELVIPSGLGPVKIVSSDPYSPLADNLSRALTRAGTQPAIAPLGCAPALPTIPASAAAVAIEPAAIEPAAIEPAAIEPAAIEPAAIETVPGALPACPAVATLRIVSETWDQGPLSVDSFSHVREYIITYTVKFAFVDANNVDIDALQDVKLQRDFTYDDSHALGSSEEQSTIREEMQRDMAASIMRRIGIALRSHAF